MNEYYSHLSTRLNSLKKEYGNMGGDVGVFPIINNIIFGQNSAIFNRLSIEVRSDSCDRCNLSQTLIAYLLYNTSAIRVDTSDSIIDNYNDVMMNFGLDCFAPDIYMMGYGDPYSHINMSMVNKAYNRYIENYFRNDGAKVYYMHSCLNDILELYFFSLYKKVDYRIKVNWDIMMNNKFVRQYMAGHNKHGGVETCRISSPNCNKLTLNLFMSIVNGCGKEYESSPDRLVEFSVWQSVDSMMVRIINM